MTPLTWTGRLLALAVVLATADVATAQLPQPQINPAFRPGQPRPNPPKNNGIIFHPQVGGWPGLPAAQFNPGPFFNPALNNPWMNQTNVIPVNPFVNNPFAVNPWNNPFNNPLAVNPFNNPFAMNPLLNKR